MADESIETTLFFITHENQKLPLVMSLLFSAASKGNEKAQEAIIKEFTPTIKRIAITVLDKYKLTEPYLLELLFNSGVRTLLELKIKHNEEGFCRFLLWAIRENMTACLACEK